MVDKRPLLPSQRIERAIVLVRNQKVLLDADLARLYGVTTSNLNKAVRRNLDRFPDDFMFQLTADEMDVLRFQSGISKHRKRGGRRYLPFAFTEHGVAMLSSVLNSDRAVEVNIQIMRAFVRLREFLATHRELADKLKELESKLGAHDQQIQVIFRAIHQLMVPPKTKRRPIGFIVKEKPARYGSR